MIKKTEISSSNRPSSVTSEPALSDQTVKWPNQRGFFQVQLLHTKNTLKSLQSDNPKVLDLLGEILYRPKGRLSQNYQLTQ